MSAHICVLSTFQVRCTINTMAPTDDSIMQLLMSERSSSSSIASTELDEESEEEEECKKGPTREWLQQWRACATEEPHPASAVEAIH